MDALNAPAQIWVPAAGLAALLVIRAWLGCLADTARTAKPAGYFISFGLGVIAPVAAAVIAWSLYGGRVQSGPILILEAASLGERHLLLAALLSPALLFLLARFIFSSADGLSYAAATAGAFALAHLLSPPAVPAVALALGGLIGFADRMLGKTPMAMAGVTAFALLFGYVYAGGGAAIPIIALSLVGGMCLSLFAAGARVPLYMLLAAVPAFALAAIANDGGPLDLSAHMPKPAIANYAALLVMFVVFPAVAAPFAVLPIWFTGRVRTFLGGRGRVWFAPFAILVELIVGAALAAALLFALTAGGALFGRLHEAVGGAILFKMSALIGQIKPAPLGASNAWLFALLALPLAPALEHILECAMHLFGRVLTASGVSERLGKPVTQSGLGARLLAMSAWRMLQLVPAALGLLAIIGLASLVAQHYGNQFAQAGDALMSACNSAAHGIESWRPSVAALCSTSDPSCK